MIFLDDDNFPEELIIKEVYKNIDNLYFAEEDLYE